MLNNFFIKSAWRRNYLILLAIASASLISGCASTTKGGAVGVERSQFLLLSSNEVNQAASKAYLDTISKAKSKQALNTDVKQTERVKKIVSRLIPNTAVFRPDAPDWKWEANVLTSDEVNAWCMPGGKIAVYTGIIEKLKLDDSELAAIIGHEIAHALREHGRENASRQAATGIGVQLLGAVTGIGSGAMDLVKIVSDVTLNLPNSRGAETEADRIGVELAARSGYDPKAAISLWMKMQKLGGGSGPSWLSTHPSNNERIKDLEVYAEKVKPLYLEYSQKHK